MRTLVEATGPRPRLAIVLLSGAYAEPEDFLREGFVDALRARGVEAEVVMAGVRVAHFADGSVVDRIRDSVLGPVKARGFTRIWIAGISLGALATLCHAARHEDEAERRLLLSPYPGTREVWCEIAAAGGLASWRPSLPPGGDLEREAWHWLAQGGARRTPVECWFGAGDRFVEGQRMMASALPPASVHEVEGGHGWKDWQSMWRDFVRRLPA
ncbi:MAG TPA: alpha/beta hydrolase-fold protein [Usitatibacter sp.]|nr:alpha/beta hydrolase-fold protein [Usitatibacter sp.]